MKRYRFKTQPFSTRRLQKKARRNFLLTILLGAALIYFLFAWFLPTLIGSLSFLNRFKDIPKSSVLVIEDATLAPPVLNIPYEATNSATINLTGYASSHSFVEIYVDDDLKTKVETKENGSFTAEAIPLTLGSNNISGKTVDEKGHKSLFSKPILVTYSNEKPKLDLKEPTDNQEIKGGDKKVVVSGTTSPDVTLTINGARTIVDSSGNFSQSIDLSEGDNTITIVAITSAGNVSQLNRQVSYQP